MGIDSFLCCLTLRNLFMGIIKGSIVLLWVVFAGCSFNSNTRDANPVPNQEGKTAGQNTGEINVFPARKLVKPQIEGFREALSFTELKMIEHGLTDVQKLDSTIVVDLKYSGTDNFLGQNVYGGMKRAYLQPDVAAMLVASQQYLKEIKPGYSLIVFDAARPRSVQQKMWDIVDAPIAEKTRFLANPSNGSIHSFGAAVDVSVLNSSGEMLDMGTEFDHMGELAYPRMEEEMLLQGRLTPFHIKNRQLLRSVMQQGGFWGIQTEWWHFNACTRAEARERYTIIE